MNPLILLCVGYLLGGVVVYCGLVGAFQHEWVTPYTSRQPITDGDVKAAVALLSSNMAYMEMLFMFFAYLL